MASGTTDLAEAFETDAYDETMIRFKDSTGLLLTSHMGRHIVDWMPDASESDETVRRGEYTASNYTSVSNGFAAHGLALLAHMTKNETVAAAGKALEAAIVKQMWNGTAFCDGPCSEVCMHRRHVILLRKRLLCAASGLCVVGAKSVRLYVWLAGRSTAHRS